MRLENVRPMLMVKHIEETITFYSSVLGFECSNRMEHWAALRKDDVELMITLPHAHGPFKEPTFTGSLYFNTNNVDAIWELVKDKARVVYPIENFFYGMREFAICD